VRETIDELVKETIRELNEDLNEAALECPDEQTPLFELLDSMAVLDFILGVEERIQQRFGRYVQIADETTMDASATPFKSVGSAVDFIMKKVQNDG